MTEFQERVCVGCGDSEEVVRLELCGVCRKNFCPDCAHRAAGHRFCSRECARAWYFAGENDDDENDQSDE